MRSYRTLSPLPVPPKGPSAVYFLWHFPSPAETDARVLPGTLLYGARTFLHRCREGPDGDPHFAHPCVCSLSVSVAGNNGPRNYLKTSKTRRQ